MKNGPKELTHRPNSDWFSRPDQNRFGQNDCATQPAMKYPESDELCRYFQKGCVRFLLWSRHGYVNYGATFSTISVNYQVEFGTVFNQMVLLYPTKATHFVISHCVTSGKWGRKFNSEKWSRMRSLIKRLQRGDKEGWQSFHYVVVPPTDMAPNDSVSSWNLMQIVWLMYRVTKQLVPNLQLTFIWMLRFSIRTLEYKRNFHINVNGRFGTSCLVTL